LSAVVTVVLVLWAWIKAPKQTKVASNNCSVGAFF